MKVTNLFKIEKIPFILLIFFPISIIIGQAAISINYFLLAICFFFFLGNNEFKLLLKKYFFIILPFFLIIIFSSLFNQDKYSLHNLDKSFFYLKNFFLFFVLIFILKNEYYRKIFYYVILCCCIFVAVDNFIQFFFGVDIFGYEKAKFRLTGPFGDNEYVSGSYLAKLSILISPLLLIKKNSSKNYYFYFFIFFIFFSIILTGERASTLIFSIGIFFFYYLLDRKLKKIFILFSLFVFILITLVTFNKTVKYKFLQTSYQVGLLKYYGNKITVSEKDYPDFENRNFFDSNHGAHFLTAYEIWKKNKLIGVGLKNFSKECKNDDYKNINSLSFDKRCSSHPHNFYLELLSEFGLTGFILFFLIILKIYNIYQMSLFKENIFLKASLCQLVTVLWPITSTGSIISNFNGSFIWINLALFVLICEYGYKNE